MQHDPQFTEWLSTAQVGDTYVLEAHPSKLDDLRRLAFAEASRQFVDLEATRQPTALRFEVTSVEPEVRLAPADRAKKLLARLQLLRHGHLYTLPVRPQDLEPLLQELQRLFVPRGFNVRHAKDVRSGRLTTLRFESRFRQARLAEQPGVSASQLQSPDDLEAKGLLRFDSKDLKTEPSGPQDGAGEFSVGGRG